jgi:hypothetical protein
LFRVPPVDLDRLDEVVLTFTNLRLLVLNAFPSLRPDVATRLASSGRIWFDTATLEGVDGIATLIKQIGPERLTLGSHWPLFYQQAALLKLRESSLPESILRRVSRQNALDLLDVESKRPE